MTRTRRRHVPLAAGAAALAALGAGTSPAAARDDVVRSFDGTRIAVSYFRAEGLPRGERAPTVLVGHGWGGERYARGDGSSGAGESLGPAPLVERGYNVLTWDARGFGESGELVRVDAIRWEARDVRKLIGYVARQPSARLDAPRDPRVGMAGGSYGGGIQLNTAVIDDRVDAIVPGIAWHSLVTSVAKRTVAKGGWGSVLYGTGVATASLAPGVVGPGLQAGNLHPQVHAAFRNGVLKGKLSARNRRFFRSRGPLKRVRAIDAPTLLVQGTVDTLFTPQEAAANYRVLRRAGTPVKMIWFCGGHGICSTEFGPRSPIEAPPDQVDYTRRVALRWFARHLKGRDVGTGSRFRWFADDGELRSARRYPREDRVLTGRGSGLLSLVQGAGADSGTLIAASPSDVAVNVPIRSARRSGDLLRPPRLTITYSGTATPRRTFVYAQIVKGDHVVSNQVSPVPLLLNGQQHTRRLRLEIPAARANRGTRYTLQLIPGTNVYFSQRASGAVRFHGVKVKLPVSRAH